MIRVLLAVVALALAACKPVKFDEDDVPTDPGTPVTAVPAEIRLLTSSAQLPAGATESDGVTLTAIVLDSGSRTIEGIPVAFSLGTVGSGVLRVTQGTTDGSGVAQAILHTGGNASFPRTINVFASVTGVTEGPLAISVVDPNTPPANITAANLNLFASAPQLLSTADTSSEGVTVTASVTDTNGVAVSGATVTFSLPSNNGRLEIVRGVTDNTGTAVAILTTNGVPTPRTIDVRARISTSTSTITQTIGVPVVPGAANVNGTVSSLRLPADNSVPVTIRARAVNEEGDPVNAVPVTFFASSGSLIGGTACVPASTRCTVLTTDSTGETGTATLTTGGDPTLRNITVTLSSPGTDEDPSNNTATIAVVPVVASVDVLSTSSTLRADADTVAEGVGIIAVVTDAAGSVLAGEAVTFTIFSGDGRVVTTSGVTDSGGAARATLITTNPSFTPTRTITVRATAQATKFGSRQITVVDPNAPPVDPDVDVIEVLASAASMAGDADTAAEGVTLTAIVTDANGNVVPGVAVAFSVPSGTGSLQVTRATTDATGTATAILTTGGNSTPRTVTVTASATGAGGTESDTVDVAVVAPASTVALVTITRDSPSIRIDADAAVEGVTFTALARNATGVALSGKTLTFAVASSGGANRNGALTVTNAVTDANGNASAVLTVGQAQVGDQLTVSATFDAPSGTDPTGSASVSVVQVSSSIAEIDLLVSSPQLSSNAVASANGVTLTAIVKDATQSVLAGVPVTFAITSTGPTGDGTLTPINLTTNASGVAQTILTTGGNTRNRSITVTASASGFAGPNPSVDISVVGTNITISGPSNTQADVQTEYTAVLLDSGGGPITGQSVVFDYVAADLNGVPDDGPGGVGDDNECAGVGTFFNPNGTANPTGQVTTNVSGLATIRLDADTCGALQATSLGASDAQSVAVSTDCFEFIAPSTNAEIAVGGMQTVTVRWQQTPCDGTVDAALEGRVVDFSTTRGSITGGDVDSDSATISGGVATVTISASQAGAGLIGASSSALSRPSTERAVEFVATVPASVAVQASPATIGTNQQSTISAVVRDAANNLVKNATVQFVLTDTTGGSLSAGQAVTNSQGRAQVTYSASSTPSSANGVRIDGTVTAVSGAPVTQRTGTARLTVGAAGLNITLGTGNTVIEENFTTYVLPYSVRVTDAANNPAPNAQVSLSIHPVMYMKGTSVFATRWFRVGAVESGLLGSASAPIECVNEDLLTGNPNFDLNGILDSPDEDINGNGILEPGGVAQVPLTVTLDANGAANFEVRYPQDMAYWARVRLRATAAVAGSESVSQVFFELPGSDEDFNTETVTPPGFDSPFGTLQDCTRTGTATFTSDLQHVSVGDTVTAGVTLSTPAGSNPISIPFTVGGTAAPGDSVVNTPSPLIVPANGSGGTISVTIQPGATAGTTVLLVLDNPDSQARLGDPSTQTLLIDGAFVGFTATTSSFAEGNTVSVRVELDRALATPVQVPFTITDVTTDAADYVVNTTSPLMIPAGQRTATIDLFLQPNNDTNDAVNEVVRFTLQNPTAPGVLDPSNVTHDMEVRRL